MVAVARSGDDIKVVGLLEPDRMIRAEGSRSKVTTY